MKKEDDLEFRTLKLISEQIQMGIHNFYRSDAGDDNLSLDQLESSIQESSISRMPSRPATAELREQIDRAIETAA